MVGGPRALAFTAIGLIGPWGEVFRRWIPFMGITIRGDAVRETYPGEAGGWEAAWLRICYAPLILWGPLLAVLTVAYWKRRCAAENMRTVAC